MPAVHVCPLSRLSETVESANASHLVTLINVGTPVARPPSIVEQNHLFLGMNDITEPMEGMVFPGAEHVERLVDFVSGDWRPTRPIVIHCYAGISRSTAAAYITLCALNPERDEVEIATLMRAASPYATPNARLVQVADDLLGRRGRMVDAVSAIGRGAFASENVPFSIDLRPARR